MEYFLIIYRVVSIITLIYGLYYVITGIIGLLLKSKEVENNKKRKQNKFAIIVAARNEEMVIGNLIDSLNNQNYNKDKYDVYVVINNTTDNTEKVVKKHHAIALNCDRPVSTKADALCFAFDTLKDHKDIDAYLIFDADNVVHPDFLLHMNKAINNGYRVAQGFRDSKNPADTWISGSYTVFYYIQNLFFCKARMSLNANSSITGTGFMIKKDIIDSAGFNTYTLTEDMEFAGQCALKGERIAYVEEAITYDEYPTKFNTSWKQRKRWTAGNYGCMKLYSFKLLKEFFRTGRLECADMALIFAGAFSQVIVYINLFIFRIVNFSQGYTLISQDYLSWILSYLLQVGLAIVAIKGLNRSIRPLWKGIVLFPLFILTWLPINFICLIKKYTKWEEIKHDRVVKLEEI